MFGESLLYFYRNRDRLSDWQAVLPPRLQTQIDRLPLSALEQLSEDLLDFSTLTDLETWVAQRTAID